MTPVFRSPVSRFLTGVTLAVGLALAAPASARAQVTAFKQAVAEAASADSDIAAFYRGRGFRPIWTGEGHQDLARRAALLDAIENVGTHGIPDARYDVDAMRALMAEARTTRDLGFVEVEISKLFLRYAKDLDTGMLKPSTIDGGMLREVPLKERSIYLEEFAAADPTVYLRDLAPNTPQYLALAKTRLNLEQQIAAGGWGPTVRAKKLEPGMSGSAVVALRDRLIAMGFLRRSVTDTFDPGIERALQAFQRAHGLEPDGVAGPGTLEEINRSPSDRLRSVLVAMERERWLPDQLGDRHILVNQTDFTAKIIDEGAVTFETRSVIGKNTSDRRSPEFSDEMEHMVINPSWYVPRSIITKEYLPKLRANPNAVGHLEITDSRGRRVGRDTDFSQYSARSFPFAMRQPPGKKNALGLVKFMFPNKHNIYLHDTPQKHLFAREVRAYSHGCIRLAEPFDFAYTILALQEVDPKGYFHRILDTGKETKVVLEQKIPVHIIYRTAYATPKGVVEYRRDIYGRDAKIWEALNRAGLALPGVQG
ncbi:L,D-transpeptidase family protein [Primorskyibacter sp. S87]|uniref:L,D-transpeptidase family protein n=1 Tax=Primorskyibacter sp. S87 TaxID=3415126 RepID=UPI003C7B8341